MFEFKVCIAWPMEIPHWFASPCHDPEEVGRAEFNVATPNTRPLHTAGQFNSFVICLIKSQSFW